MGDNEFIAWTAFPLLALAVTVMLLLILSPTTGHYEVLSPGAAIWGVGALALLAASAGFIAFRRPQGRVAAIGGVVLLIAVLFVTPVWTVSWPLPSQ